MKMGMNIRDFYIKLVLVFFLFVAFKGNGQDMSVSILGGAVVTQGSTITINAGASLTFQITNTSSNCSSLKIKDIDISDVTNFSISPSNPTDNIKSINCKKGDKDLNFTVYADNTSSCGSYTTRVTIDSNEPDFWFDLTINSSPEIYVLGGNPFADINDGDTTTSDTNGTYFGVVDEGSSVTRTFIVANIGSCPLNVLSVTSSNPDFVITTEVYSIPFYNLDPYYYITFDVTFTGPVAGAGIQTSTISIGNNDNTTFTFNVSAEMFDFDIPGPGGITADFRLWLKSTRGIKFEPSTSDKVRCWLDLGTNGKNAEQLVAVNQPTFLDDEASNINFNPVIKFENDGGSLEQYMYNVDNGFYSQDIFIVMIPDATITSASLRNTIFAGISSGSAGDVTGVGFGNYSSEFTDETLSYNQDVPGGGSYNGEAEISTTYTGAGIINIRNDADPATSQELLLNSSLLTTTSVNDIAYANVGYVSGSTVFGTKYWIGRNLDVQGSLNGRVAEIFTFAERVSDADRQKIESYLAIKYGITLGASAQTEKDYINSAGTKIWDKTINSGYNYNIAGIGRDSISDLNQKQSKSLNEANEVTIGLGGIFSTNSANTNEFSKDEDFLVWGCNNGAYTGLGANTITIGASLTTSLTRIDRKWKVVESKVDVDVETVYIAIPSAAFSSFSKNADEEYVLIVADNSDFANADIIDVIPLKSDGGSNLQTWYDFDGTKFFTFGKTAKLSGNRLVDIASGDYLVGERALNLGVDAFTISAWIKSTPTASDRTIMSKGAKLQFILNNSNKIEIWSDDNTAPKFTSNMAINDSKWHQISMVYDSGTIFLYVDGILDKSVQDIVHPSINYNHYSIGALYLSKDNITNPFLGEIDEVYAWDIGLTGSQIRYLMNQEIEKITGDLVNGKTIPQAITNNEVVAIPWNKLKVYYDFNSFFGSTVEGLTDERNFLRIKYLNKTKTIVDLQTAPIPYISADDGAWDDAGTWSNSGSQNLPNSLGLDGSMVDWNIVETSHNITSGDRDITVLGIISTAGKLTIANTTDPQDETNGGQGLTISHYLELDGVIELVGESQLVQDEGSTLDADSGGYIERDQQGTASSFNYNNWSSSVQPISGNTSTRGTGVANTNANHSISEVLKDGTQDVIFSPSYSASDGGATSPVTLSSYWLYKFNGANDDYNAWASINENTVILPGEGYTMKGTSGAVVVTDSQNYTFKGKPNNGTIKLPIITGNTRLIGNPYPSSIDANEFILDNIKETINAEEGRNTFNIFNGALYFWHHFGQVNSHNLSDYVGGYAIYTLMGGVEAFSTDSRIDNSTPLVGGGKIPERYIAVNQGFFVIALLDPAIDSTTTSVDGGDIVFKNSQRAFERERFTGVNEGSLFFKTSKKHKTKEVSENSDIRAKIRLQFNSPNGFHRKLLVGEDINATNNFDLGYDAPAADLGKDDMFWFFNNSKFVIQAVNNFDKNQELLLGIKLEKDGLVSIKIDSLENIDKSVEIYIKDKSTGETYQINNQSFELNLTAGEYLNRFALVFEPRLKTFNEITLIEGVNVFMNNTTSELKIRKIVDTEINEINLFNYLGQNVGSWIRDFKEREISIPVNKETGAYIVQITTKNNGVLSKKIIIK